MSSDGPGQETITSRPVLPPAPPPLGRGRTALRAVGLLAGLGAVLAAAPWLRPAEGPPPLPLSVTAELTRTGEISAYKKNQLLAAVPLRPGQVATGTIAVVSTTWIPVNATLTNSGPPEDIEGQLWVRATLDGAVIHDGLLADLREGSSGAARLDSGQRADLTVAVSLIDGAADTHQGRTADVKLDLTATPVED